MNKTMKSNEKFKSQSRIKCIIVFGNDKFYFTLCKKKKFSLYILYIIIFGIIILVFIFVTFINLLD